MNRKVVLESALKLIGSTLVISGAVYFGHSYRPVRSDEGQKRTPRILYYQDPMHPQYRSDKAGIAPDCGMALEPVYASTVLPKEEDSGAVHVEDEAQRISGIRTATVKRELLGRHLDSRGTVVADETRIFKVTALADGVVKSVSPFAAGSVVHKGELLATYFVPTRDLYNAVQAYVLASGAFDQAASSVRDQSFINTAKAQTRVEEELLKSYGLGSQQIRELARSREVTRDIDFRSPADGIVLDRSVNLGQTLSRGAELARIADLSHIWVLVDVYESDFALYRPGKTALVSYGEHTYPARISDARNFDASSRTFKVRLELANPGLILRPDMFVRIDLPVSGAPGLTVPSEAILDSGLRKVAYVKLADGSFVPREVKTGIEISDRIQVLDGLEEGSEVATSGTFLLDSESQLQVERLQARKSTTHEVIPVSQPENDPACGMPIQRLQEVLASDYLGKRVHFCSKACKAKFDSNPSVYMRASGTSPLESAALRGRR